jgi:hypothetical protein
MSKPISRALHGPLADYPFVAFTAAAPNLAGFQDEKTATLLCRALSGTALLASLLTRAEWGVFRVLPFKLHLTLDALTGVLALGAPWLFGFSKNSRARNTFLALGIFGLVGGLLSEPEEMP